MVNVDSASTLRHEAHVRCRHRAPTGKMLPKQSRAKGANGVDKCNRFAATDPLGRTGLVRKLRQPTGVVAIGPIGTHGSCRHGRRLRPPVMLLRAKMVLPTMRTSRTEPLWGWIPPAPVQACAPRRLTYNCCIV